MTTPITGGGVPPSPPRPPAGRPATPRGLGRHIIPEKGGAIFWLCAIWVTALAICLTISFTIITLLGLREVKGVFLAASLLGIIGWLLLAYHFYDIFLITVEEFTTWVTVSLLGTELRHYHTGTHIIRPWELPKPENKINHELRSVSFEEQFSTKGGKGRVVIKASYTWKVKTDYEAPDAIEKFMMVGDSVVQDYFSKQITNLMSQTIGRLEVAEVFEDTERLKNSFQTAFEGRTDEEVRFGISFEGLSVGEILPDSATQKMLSDILSAEAQAKVIEATKDMTPEQREFSLINSGKLTKTIAEERKSGESKVRHEYDIKLDGADFSQAIPALTAAATAISSAVHGAQQLSGQGKPNKQGGKPRGNPPRPQQNPPPTTPPPGNTGGTTP